MLVRCDKCGQGYEVNETRISSQGAKIKCPACANIFLVQLNNGVATVSSNQLDAVTSFYDDDAGKKQEAEELWRVRHMGLTYTFHDIGSLQDWLSGRPSLDDVKVAKNEDDWKELGDYPNVMTAELIMKFFPLGDVPKTGSKSASSVLSSGGLEKKPGLGAGLNADQFTTDPVKDAKKAKQIAKARKEEQKRLEEEKKGLKKRITILVVILVLVLFGVGGFIWIQKGILDVPDVLNINNKDNTPTQTDQFKKIEKDFESVKNTTPEAVQARRDNPDAQVNGANNIPTDEELREAAEAEIKNRINEAADMVKNRRWPEARATLETIVEEQPENVEAMQLLLQAYRGLNLEKQASELDARIKKVKAKLAAEAKKQAESAGEVFEGGDWEE